MSRERRLEWVAQLQLRPVAKPTNPWVIRAAYVPAAIALSAAIWVEHGPIYAVAVVLGGLGLGLLVDHRAKRQRAERSGDS